MKGIFVDTNFYHLCVTLVVLALHLLFDVLSFKNEISFWRSRKTIKGLSTKALLLRACSLTIIFIYLLEQNKSALVLIPSGIYLLIEYWKCTKALRVSIIFIGGLPRINLGTPTAKEVEIGQFDTQAMKWLGWIIFPLCIGEAVYSFDYVPHKSWYSWCIESLANGVYSFGFLFMLPQFFVNYKLKSVVHLPWRGFFYKAITSLIDEVIGFVIIFPIEYTGPSSRDYLIFFVYFCQALTFCYPIDCEIRGNGNEGREKEMEEGFLVSQRKMEIGEHRQEAGVDAITGVKFNKRLSHTGVQTFVLWIEGGATSTATIPRWSRSYATTTTTVCSIGPSEWYKIVRCLQFVWAPVERPNYGRAFLSCLLPVPTVYWFYSITISGYAWTPMTYPMIQSRSFVVCSVCIPNEGQQLPRLFSRMMWTPEKRTFVLDSASTCVDLSEAPTKLNDVYTKLTGQVQEEFPGEYADRESIISYLQRVRVQFPDGDCPTDSNDRLDVAMAAYLRKFKADKEESQKRVQDDWVPQLIGSPFPPSPVRVPGEMNMYVSMWYKYDNPIHGRSWNNGGVVECSFPFRKKELTRSEDLGGEIQVLQYTGDHNTQGFWYEWVQYKDRSEKTEDRSMLKCGDSVPILWKDRKEGALLGYVNTKTAKAHFSHDKTVTTKSGAQINDMYIIMRNIKGGPQFCECANCPKPPPPPPVPAPGPPPPKVMLNEWMDIRVGDAWPSRPLVKALNKTIDSLAGANPDQYVALWYQSGEPVMGRVWNADGKVAANFGWFNNEYSNNVGSIQLLVQSSEHVRGFDYGWIDFPAAASFDKEKEWHPVHANHYKGDISPCVLNVDGKQILGKCDVRNEKASYGYGGKENIHVGPAVHKHVVLCRKAKKGYKFD